MNDSPYLALAKQVINDNYRVYNQLYKEILANVNAFLNTPEVKAILENKTPSVVPHKVVKHLRIVGKDEPFVP